MRKLLTTLFIMMFTALSGNCTGLFITNSNTTITDTIISQNLMMSFDSLAFTTISVKALDAYVVNQLNPNIKIPISKIFISTGTNKKQMQYGVSVPVLQVNPLTIANINQSAYLTIEDTRALPAGTYSANLQFTCTNLSLVSTNFMYVLTFTVPPILEVTSSASTCNINLTEDEVFLKNVKIKNVADVQINIKANQAWNFYIDTTNMGSLKGEYFVRVKTVSNIINYETGILDLKPNQKFFVASGSSTSPIGSDIPTYLTLEYSFQNVNDSYVLEGVGSNPIKYSLEAAIEGGTI